MNYRNYLSQNIWTLLLLIAFSSCKETLPEKLVIGEVPSPVYDVVSEAFPGEAILRFSLPAESKDLLYVRAEYEIRPGVTRTTTASIYDDFMKLEGFYKAGTFPVKLYSVSKGEVISKPLEISIDILEPAYLTTFKSLEVRPSFGAVAIQYNNPEQKTLEINIASLNKDNKKATIRQSLTTSELAGEYKPHGYKDEPTDFFITVSDRWGNVSDTLRLNLTPLLEEELQKNLFKSYPLPPFNNESFDGYTLISNLWNNKTGEWYYGYSAYMSKSGTVVPSANKAAEFSFDVGRSIKLSRFKLFHPFYYTSYVYAFKGYTPKEFEIWGSNDPAADGSWESWTLIGEFTSKKPEKMSANDLITYGTIQGEDFSIPVNTGSFRYYRWKIKANWGTENSTSIDEITLWGGQIK